MQLTGPPRLAWIARPLATASGPIVDAWEERQTVVRGRSQTRRKGLAELWPSWQFEVLVTAGQWLGWRSDLLGDEAGEVAWCPRTRAAGDPTWLPEHTYTVRCVSDLPTLEELRLTDADGRGRYRVTVRLDGVEPVAELPDTVRGGYDLLGGSRDGLGLSIAAYGRDATITDAGYLRVSLLGESYDLARVELGSPLCAAARGENTDRVFDDTDDPWLGVELALRRLPIPLTTAVGPLVP